MYVISDLDGTISNCDHRAHYLDGQKKKDWPAFFKACGGDSPIKPVIETLNALSDGGNTIAIHSGRGEEVRKETEKWLKDNGVEYDILLLRPTGSRVSSVQLKQTMLDNVMTTEDILCAFENSEKDANMYRKNGVLCFLME